MATRLTARQRRQNRMAPTASQMATASNYVNRVRAAVGADAPRQLRAAIRQAQAARRPESEITAVRLAARTSAVDVPTQGMR